MADQDSDDGRKAQDGREAQDGRKAQDGHEAQDGRKAQDGHEAQDGHHTEHGRKLHSEFSKAPKRPLELALNAKRVILFHDKEELKECGEPAFEIISSLKPTTNCLSDLKLAKTKTNQTPLLLASLCGSDYLKAFAATTSLLESYPGLRKVLLSGLGMGPQMGTVVVLDRAQQPVDNVGYPVLKDNYKRVLIAECPGFPAELEVNFARKLAFDHAVAIEMCQITSGPGGLDTEVKDPAAAGVFWACQNRAMFGVTPSFATVLGIDRNDGREFGLVNGPKVAMRQVVEFLKSFSKEIDDE